MGERYNGWKNYETWVTALWIDNDEGSYNESREIVREVAKGMAAPRYDVADALKSWVEESTIDPITEELPASLATDLLRAAFSEVDWYEIADNYLSEIADEEPTDA